MLPMPRSLAYRTDLSILSFEGKVSDREDYYVAETPNNPGFFWGNLLLMKRPPGPGDFDTWTKLFQKEFSHQPLVKHMTFGWDSPEGVEGDLKPFVDAGFDVERSVVLTAQPKDLVVPRKMHGTIEVRPLKTDDEWNAAIVNQVACRRSEFKEEMYLAFKTTQMAKYRRMSDAGLGYWFGAFLNGKLVAECGLVVFNGIGRYQAVGTHPEFRRLGICGALIYYSAQYAFSSMKAKTLVMAAEPEDHAARVYESVGFKLTEKQIGVYKWPREEWA